MSCAQVRLVSHMLLSSHVDKESGGQRGLDKSNIFITRFITNLRFNNTDTHYHFIESETAVLTFITNAGHRRFENRYWQKLSKCQTNSKTHHQTFVVSGRDSWPVRFLTTESFVITISVRLETS